MRLEPDEPGGPGPEVREDAQPPLVLDGRVANHDRIDADADLGEVIRVS